MVGMSGSPIGQATFTYDPFGRRASKTIAGATTQFQYDGRRVVQEIQPGAGNVLTNMGLSRTDSTGNMTFLGDILGSTLALANDAGAVATQYSYEPFGASTASGAASSIHINLLFTRTMEPACTTTRHVTIAHHWRVSLVKIHLEYAAGSICTSMLATSRSTSKTLQA